MTREESEVLRAFTKALTRAVKLRDDLDYLPQTPATVGLLGLAEDVIRGLRKLILREDQS